MNPRVEGISLFEKLLFVLTRIFAVVLALAAIAGIVVCVLFLLGKFDKPVEVTLDEVMAKVHGASASEKSAQATQSAVGYTIPPKVRQYLSEGNNWKVLSGWLNQLESDSERQDFLDNLARIIEAAEGKNENVVQAINAYKDLKLQKMSASTIDRYAVRAAKGGAAAADVIPDFSSVMLWSPISTRGDRTHEEAFFGRADHRVSAGG